MMGDKDDWCNGEVMCCVWPCAILIYDSFSPAIAFLKGAHTQWGSHSDSERQENGQKKDFPIGPQSLERDTFI